MAEESALRAEELWKALESGRRDEEERRARESARRAEEERKARESARRKEEEWSAREAARKADQARVIKESTVEASYQPPTPGAEGRNAGTGGNKSKRWFCLLLALIFTAIGGGATVYFVYPLLTGVDVQDEPTIQAPTATPIHTFPTSPPATAPPIPTPTLPSVFSPIPPDAQSAATDREVLIRLYEATDGQNWEKNDNWLTDATLNHWYGVYIDEEGRVRTLFFTDNNLNGVIPINLLNLGKLDGLYVGGNRFTGCLAEGLEDAIENNDLSLLGLPVCDVVPTPVPSPTPIPTATPIPTPTPIPTATPVPTASPVPVPTATLTPAPTSTPRPTPTPGPCRNDVQCLREHALRLINNDRARHGLRPVVLGSNIAAQLHAQDMVEHGYLGHWWVDGRKPYMVYSQTGGTSYASENAAFSGWTDQRWESQNCDSWLVRCEIGSPEQEITEYQWGMMYDDAHADWGHRDNILGESHRAVNIGIWWNKKRVAFVQHFEGGAVTARSGPTISRNGVLALELVKRERGIDIGQVVSVYYDPLPVRMSLAQIERLDSYCVGGGQTTRCGEPVIRVLRPPGANYYYSNLEHNEIVADSWTESNNSFSFSADVSRLVQRAGVYTVIVWRDTGGGLLSEQLLELSVFVR